MVDVMFHIMVLAIEHDKRNIRDFNQILLSNKDWNYLLWVAHEVVKSSVYDCLVI